VDPRTPTVKHIAGQAAYQLAVMYTLVFHAPALLGIPGALPRRKPCQLGCVHSCAARG
jgi:hypothetical protein